MASADQLKALVRSKFYHALSGTFDRVCKRRNRSAWDVIPLVRLGVVLVAAGIGLDGIPGSTGDSYLEGDEDPLELRLNLSELAAHEAKLGHGKLAEELRWHARQLELFQPTSKFGHANPTMLSK